MADALARLRARRAERSAEERVIAATGTKRECGACDLCCTAPGIDQPDIAKPIGERCRHLAGEPGHSCAIYAERPAICRKFLCLWRWSDMLPADWRPADCGFVLTFNNLYAFPVVITAHPDPDRPRAWDTPKNRARFSAIARDWNCIVAIGQQPLCSHLFGPNGAVFERGKAMPGLFERGGDVGLPSWCFGPDRRPLIERLKELVDHWRLP